MLTTMVDEAGNKADYTQKMGSSDDVERANTPFATMTSKNDTTKPPRTVEPSIPTSEGEPRYGWLV